jgi:hypothetical protein
MSSKFYGRFLVISAALALGACASTQPAAPPSVETSRANLALASNNAAVSEASSPLGTSGATLKPGNGYRKVVKNGETYYCEKTAATGTRVNAKVTCLTQAEMTALSQNGQDLLNGVRSQPGSQGAVGGNGATFGSTASYQQ